MSDKSGAIASPALIYPFPIFAGLLLHYLSPLELLIYPFNWGLGSLLFIIGIFLGAWAVKSFRDEGTNIDIHKPTLKIVDKGPYRFTRNPMYLSLTLFYLSTAFFFNTAWIILIWPISLLIIQQKVIKREERYLEQKFGDKYLTYKRKVRCWI